MRATDRFWLVIGAMAAAMFLIRCLEPDIMASEENLKKFIDLQPMFELLIIALCLWTIVPGLFIKMKGQTAYDLIYYSCFFIGAGLLFIILPGYIPAEATKDEQQTYINLIVYGLLGLFLLTYAMWNDHKRKIAKKKMDAVKAEGDEAHAEAIRKLEGGYYDQGNEDN